jgi:RNA polymerase sigma factor (sigma-70 family)
MPAPELDTLMLQGCIDRYRSGDRGAMDDLLRAAGSRLEKLARRMTRTFPNVRDQADSADVLQGSLVRLLRTLQTLRPPTTRDFFNLAAVHIRRELLDLARRCKKRRNDVALEVQDDSHCAPGAPPAVAADVGADFDLWVRFHEAVDALPVEEREVVGLVFYHGWTQVKIAEMFGVDERTVRRRWATACDRLRQQMGDLPGA